MRRKERKLRLMRRNERKVKQMRIKEIKSEPDEKEMKGREKTFATLNIELRIRLFFYF